MNVGIYIHSCLYMFILFVSLHTLSLVTPFTTSACLSARITLNLPRHYGSNILNVSPPLPAVLRFLAPASPVLPAFFYLGIYGFFYVMVYRRVGGAK